MTPGFAKSREELFYLPYPEHNRLIINAHNFTPAIWTPLQSTPLLWLDASDSATLYSATAGGSLVAADGTVARWEDKSGNSRHVTQATIASRPTRKTSIQNSLDVLRFDGANDFFNADLALFQNKTFVGVACVIREKDATARPIFFASVGTASGTTRALLYSSNAAQETGSRRLDTDSYRGSSGANSSTVNVAVSVFNFGGNSVSQFRNGTQRGTTNTYSSGGGSSSNTASLAQYIGYDTGSYATQDVCELLYFGDATTDTRQKIEGYLAHKWGTTSGLDSGHPYKLVAP